MNDQKAIEVLNALKIRCTNSASNKEILKAKEINDAIDYAINKIKED